MKKLQKNWIYLILLGTILCFTQPILTQAQNSTISPMYVQSNKCYTYLSFQATAATCRLNVTGKKDTTSISGKLKLYDSTAAKTVKRWNISKTGAVYSVSKTATVKKGHKYKLSFSGQIYRNGSKYGEAISASTIKKN
ncbi:MAG: hypothetical protein HFJ04_02685 [Lachnospiraceae bacterium]|nr:hypothetical protein [Lachnospiraceae bacterium]